MATTGWYGPLIDLSDAASHLDGFVQLLVFVHRSRPYQRYDDLARRVPQWIDLSVGDDTLPYFSVSAQKTHLGQSATPGSIILLQNVKPVKYKDMIGTIASEISSIHVLVGPSNSMQGNREPASCQVGTPKLEKLKRVTEWVKQAGLWLPDIPRALPQKGSIWKNWMSEKQDSPTNCLSMSDVLLSTSPGCVKFSGTICEILLIDTMEESKMAETKLSIKKGLFAPANNLVDDLICYGCKVCGSLLTPSSLYKCTTAFYCKKSSDHVHISGLIYKPFLLCLTDEHDQLPVLVKNEVAEILFGNITAEKVMKSYRRKGADTNHRSGPDSLETGCLHSQFSKAFQAAESDRQLKEAVVAEGVSRRIQPDFYNIWLILLKCLLTHGKNSPFRFEVLIDMNKDKLEGKFELVSFAMPCFLI